MELIAFQKQIRSYLSRVPILETNTEKGLGWAVERWNAAIGHLALPDDLKLPLL